MNDEGSQLNPLDRLAGEFIARYRHGDRVVLSEYCAQHPELADDIRRVFPTLVVMEQARPVDLDFEPTKSDGGESARLKLERLGDYRILREIARGGMGIVYEAVQESLGRHVALKVLPPQAVLDPRHLQRFQREARAAAKLHHTNIVPVFGVGEHEGVYYYVMQFINGLGLDQVLDQVRRLRDGSTDATPRALAASSELTMPIVAPIDAVTQACVSAEQIAESLVGGRVVEISCPSTEAELRRNSDSASKRGSSTESHLIDSPATLCVRLPSDDSGSGLNSTTNTTTLSHSGSQYWQSVARIGVQVAEAIDYAFGQGVLHRDIKPSNLLLDSHGTVWVTDFGLAKAADNDDLTQTGDIVGTLRYLAPERLKGEVDLRGDLYSLGVTLYEMLTLRPPFRDHDRARLVQRIADEEPLRPRSIEPAIPHDLETIVLKAIAKDPSDRYPSARDLADDLRHFMDDKPIAARRVGPTERLWRWCRRNRIVAVLTAAVAVLLVGAVVNLSISNSRIRQESAARKAALVEKESALAEKTAALKSLAASEALDRRRFYAAQMNLAGQAFERGQLARVLDLLESQRPQPGEPDLRGFEWFYLWREIHPALHVALQQANDELWCLEFSPDGESLAIGGASSDYGVLKLWDVATGKLQTEFADPGQDLVNGLDFSPDGKLLASGSADSVVRVWNVAERRVIVRLKTGTVVRSVRWSRQRGLIAAGCQNGSVRIYDAENFELKATLSSLGTPVLGLAFSPDGTRLVTSVAWGASPKGLTRIYDLTTFPPQLSLPDLKNRFVTDFSPDGESVGSYEYGSGLLHIWNPKTGVDRMRVETSVGWMNSVRFSPDGQRIATAGLEDRVATVWDCNTGQPLIRGPHSHGIQAVAFDATRRYWASASINGEVKIWHYDVPQQTTVIKHDPDVHRMFVSSPDGTLVLGGDFPAEGRDVETGERRWESQVTHLRSISANGRVMVSALPPAEGPGPETLEIWTRDTGEKRMTWRLPDAKHLYYECITLSASGRLLATRCKDLPIRLWDVSGTTPQPLHVFGGAESMALAFSPNERLLAAACQKGYVRIFDMDSGKELPHLQGHESGSGWACSVCFSHDGQRLAAGNSFGVVRVWDLAARRLLATLNGHLGEIADLTFFPDGRRLAVSSRGSIRLWDVEAEQELTSLNTPDDLARFLVVTPDGRNLISCHQKGPLKVWKSGQLGIAP